MATIIKILKYTKQFWKYYLATGTFIIILSLLNLVNPVLSGKIVDSIVQNIQNQTGDFSVIGFLLVLTISADVLITFIQNIAGYLGDVLSSKLNTFMTSKFYQHVLALQIEYFDTHVSGEIISKLQRGIANITDFINDLLNNFLPFFLTAFFTVFFIATFSLELGLLLAILFPIYIIISDKSSKNWMKKSEVMNKIQDMLQGRIAESITSIRIVKSFFRQNLEHQKYLEYRKDIEKLTAAQSREWHAFDIFRNLILNFVLFAIYAYIVYHTFNGRYTIGEMTLLIGLVNQARWPLFAMSYILGRIQAATAGTKDFFDILTEEVKIKDKPNAFELKDVEGEIEFNGVTFGYQDAKDVLKDISFKLNKGQKLAIVGESGEGKSTIANLVLRFYEPKSGSISIDGKNVQDVKLNSLHRNISIVMQDSILFSGTIEENIKYGREGATREEVEAAAIAANAHDFIIKFEKGYETEIGERGVKLSGGQKQRLSIARAILKDSPILILDEATSSLDSKAEAEVQKALSELMKGRTTIIIAHRLATIRNVDQIIVLKGGDIVEVGSPSELIQKDGIYAELVKLQSNLNAPVEPDKKLKEFQLAG